MANEIRNYVKTLHLGNPAAKQVFLEIADLADDWGVCDYTINQIAEILEFSRKTVDRAMAFLESEKRIVRKAAKRKHGQFPQKETIIKLPQDVQEKINARRERQEPPPLDRESYGEDPPLDSASDDHGTLCPSPRDSLTNGLKVPLYKKNSEDLNTPEQKETQKEGDSLSARAQGAPPTPDKNFNSQEEPKSKKISIEFDENKFQETAAIRIWREVYPTIKLNELTLRDFAARLPEVEESIWRQNVLDWRLAGWKRTNFADMIARYERLLERAKKEAENELNGKTNGNGSGKSHGEKKLSKSRRSAKTKISEADLKRLRGKPAT